MVIPELMRTVGRLLVTNDLYQAGKRACQKHPYDAVVLEVAGRIGAREYDGWPGRPSYRVGQGQVWMWLPGKAMTTKADHVMPLLALVRRALPDPGLPPVAPPQRSQAAKGGSRAQWGEAAEDRPARKEDDPDQTKMF